MAITTFANGLRAVSTEKFDSNICSIVVHITGGCQSEKSIQSGLSEYVSRLLLCGTTNYPTKQALINYAKLNGIILKSHASREAITISAICPAATIDQAMELLSEIVFYSNFNEQSANYVKSQLLADIERLGENHNYALERSVNQALFYRTGLANPKYGTGLTVERFNGDIAKEFMQKLVTPKNTILSVVGNIDSQEFDELVEEYFVEHLPKDAEYRKIKYVAEVENFQSTIRTRNKRLNQSRMCIAFPAVSYKSSKKYLCQILENILLAKINKALRISSDYYSVTTLTTKHFSNNGKLQFELVVDYDNAKEHLLNFIKVLNDLLLYDSVTEEEFELEKNIFVTKFMYKYENCLELSLINAKETAILKHSFNQNSEKLKIEMLTYKDANKFIAETLNLNKMFVSYLGHPIELDLQELLNNN